jgi:hypothetical protein
LIDCLTVFALLLSLIGLSWPTITQLASILRVAGPRPVSVSYEGRPMNETARVRDRRPGAGL